MTNPSSNNSGLDAEDEKRKRLKEEYDLAQRLMGVFQRKLDEIRLRDNNQGGAGANVRSPSSSSSRKDGTSSFQLEPAEKELLTNINNFGLKEGVLAGVLSLVALRKVRTNMLRRIISMQQQQQSRPPHAPYQQPPNHPPHATNSPFAQVPQPGMIPPTPPPGSSSSIDRAISERMKPWSFANVFGWILDCSVSFSIAAATSLIFTDRQKVLDTVTQIPLTPGYSSVSDEFCPALCRELQSLEQHDPQQARLLQTPQSPYLKALVQFGINCQKRKTYEDELRNERGGGPGDRMSIPMPGVPANIQVDTSVATFDVQSGFVDLTDETSNEDEQGFIQQEPETNWDDDFASDDDPNRSSDEASSDDNKGGWWR